MHIKIWATLFSVLLSLRVYASEELEISAIDSLLQKTIEEQNATAPIKSQTENKVVSQAQSEVYQPTTDKNAVLKRNADIVTPGAYNEKVKRIHQILSQTDDPKTLLESLIKDGTLALSPNDIFLLRLLVDEVEKAKNSPFVSPTIINDQYNIDQTDRYKMYDIYVHDTGETLIEFLDITGEPWPIFDNSEGKGFDIQKGENNMLWITPKERHRQTNFFVTLEEYPAPIQFNIHYSNEKRHGLASFKVPAISPTNSKATSTKPSQIVNLGDVGKGFSNNANASNRQVLQVVDLSYLASTGRFKPDSDLSREAQPVFISDSNVASIWFYDDTFIIRTSYQLYSFDKVINSEGAMKVFLASRLNSIVPFYKNGATINVFIPEYHNYVGY